MSRGPDIGTALLRALEKQARHAGCPVSVLHADWQRWASATFAGARHQISVSACPCPALNDWLGGLPEAEFVMRGHLVADVVVTAVRRSAASVEADLEVLTVEES